MPRSCLICIRGEDRRVRELPTRDGHPECNAVWSGVGPWGLMALVFLVPNSNEDAPIEMGDPGFENHSDVAFIQGNHEIQTFPSGATDQAFTKSIRLGRPVGGPQYSQTQRSK